MRPTLILTMCLLCSVASAADPSARAEVQRGLVAYDLGRFPEALERFSEAYRLDPRPAFLFNIAQCHRHLGNWERAAFFYRRYLAQFTGEAPNQALVVGLISEMEQKLEQAAPLAIAGKTNEGERSAAPATDSPANLPATDPAKPLDLSGRTSVAEQPGAVPAAAIAPLPSSVIHQDESVTQKWWFWAAVGTATVAAGAGIYAATAPQPRSSSLGTLDFR